MENQTKLKILLARREYFKNLFPKIKGCNFRRDIEFELPNTCPSCGYLTLSERCSWQICPICFWEDDGQDDFDADTVYDGPNGKSSLTSYRIKFFDEFEKFKTENKESESINELRLLEHYITSNEKDIVKVKVTMEKVLNDFEAKLLKF